MFKSRYKVCIKGKDSRKFIKYLYKLNIYFINITYEDGCVYTIVDKENYDKLLKVKTSYEIKIVKRYGLDKYLYYGKKNILFLSFLVFGYFLLLGLTNITFDVVVIHNDKKIRNLLLDELKERGISKYKFRVSFDKKEKIVEEILKKYKDQLEWLEIENIGTKYIVRVEERRINKQEEVEKKENIVAKKDGIIMKIEATDGEIVKKINDYVKKGDIIISGSIMNKDKLVAVKQAKGIVMAETWYKVDVSMPMSYHEEFRTGNSKKLINIKFLNKSLALFDFKKYKHFKDEDTTLLKNKLIPLQIVYTKREELRVVDEVYTKEKAVEKAGERARLKLKQKLGVNDKIIYQKNLKITEEDSKIMVEIFFKVCEDITDTSDIVEIEEPLP